MPKETFFNLPEDKRALICDVSIDEFAEYPFDQASINRIVTNAGIAKGSFYQYFEDKRDLFLYLTELIAEEKISYLSPVISNPHEHDIFTLIKEMFLSGIQFARERPRYAAISKHVLARKGAPIYRELKINSLPYSYAVFEPLIKNAIARGEIRADMDISLLDYVITSMSLLVVEYSSEIHPESMHESLTETVDAFMDILKNGIGSNKGTAT